MVVSRFHKTDTHRGQKKKEIFGVFLILWFETMRFWPLSFLFLNYARKKSWEKYIPSGFSNMMRVFLCGTCKLQVF